MIRILLIIFISIHGLIHLLGFLKAFNIIEIISISKTISKVSGFFWLLVFILCIITVFLIVINSDLWWTSGLFFIIISQIMIFSYWSDTKYGSIANFIIFLFIIVAYSDFSFKNKIALERKYMLENSEPITNKVITRESISKLPVIVQKWLKNSGIIGKSNVSNVYLTQKLKLKMNQEQSEWNNGSAVQYFTLQPPAFNWDIKSEINSVLKVTGRDKFENGIGEMIIKIFSLIPVASAKNHPNVNQATLQRFLAEIVWFPTASLNNYITWEYIDDLSAKATMEYKGSKGTGVFHFDKNGIFKKFVALRYKSYDDKVPTKWTVTATKTEKLNEVTIPVECKVSWEIDKSSWTWLVLEITDVKYNIKMPIANRPNP